MRLWPRHGDGVRYSVLDMHQVGLLAYALLQFRTRGCQMRRIFRSLCDVIPGVCLQRLFSQCIIMSSGLAPLVGQPWSRQAKMLK